MSALGPRGTTECRGCGSADLVSVLDLGDQPLANGLGRSATDELPAFPLHLRICPVCALGQVGEFVSPEGIFGDYPYLSSASASWLEHARGYAETMTGELGLGDSDLVMEVASNDGYLLRQFQALGSPVLGIEPARNVAALAQADGVPTVAEFFGEELAVRLVAEHGHPRLVAANNVMAHVPDLNDFTAGLAALCDEQTTVTVENPTLLNLLHERQFDTIYHEHFCYLSAHAVSATAARHGLELVRVDTLPTHGGSYRYWLRRAGSGPLDDSVARALADEEAGGLLDPEVWGAFREGSQAAITGVRTWFADRRADGAVIAGYGAAAKGNTLLNAAGITADDLAYVVDASAEKQGRYLPGVGSPIHAPDELAAGRPTDVLVLPWNIAGELRPRIAAMVPEAGCWIAIPRMTRL